MDKNIPWTLIISHLKQETDLQAEAELSKWRSLPANNTVYLQLESLWEEVRNESALYDPDISFYWSRLEKRMEETNKKNIHTLSISRYQIAIAVASLLLLMATSASFFIAKAIFQPEVRTQTYTALNGKSQMILPDGSSVWLNIGSTLSYETSFGRDRVVELQGEALFEVIKDAGRPFMVSVDDIRIQVHGTRFNVNAYKENPRIKVALLEGKVSVWAGNEKSFMKPGELASFDKASQMLHIVEADVYFESFWAGRSCTFTAKPLDYICKYLERWYNIEIHLDPAIVHTNYTFTITDEPLETVLQIMSRISPLEYSFEENRDVILTQVKPYKKQMPMK